MEFLQSILDNSQYSFLTAIILGLMTAISPCPLATNITAIGFISKDIENSKKVFLNGLIYTLGRAVSYTLLAVVLYLGANQMNVIHDFPGMGRKGSRTVTHYHRTVYARHNKDQFPRILQIDRKDWRKEQRKLPEFTPIGNDLCFGFLPI